MYTAAAVGVGMLSPTLRPSASLPPLLKQTQTSPPFRETGEKSANTKNGGSSNSIIHNSNNNSNSMAAGLAQAYSRPSSQQQSDSLKLQTAASLVYAARMRQEGFPYGLSGVPAMSSYSYSSELYGYASNGFPRKSRICSYCSKVFTRSTTRRYHEKRCPLLRAAGSLMKGSSSSASSACNGYSREHADSGAGGGVLAHPPPPPPPLVPAGADSTSPPAAASKSTSVNTSPTSEGLASIARAQALNPSQFYTMYGSQFNRTTMSTSAESAAAAAAAGQAAPQGAGRQSALDHNQNSIMPVVKQEPQADEAADHAKSDQVNNDSLLLRSATAPAEGEEHHQPHPHPPPPHHQSPMLYGTSSSPTSRSRSDEEEAESDEGEQQAMKPPPVEDSTYMQQLALKRYKLAQLMALRNAQSMARPPSMLYFPMPCVTSMGSAAEKPPPLEPEPDTHSASPQKQEEGDHFPQRDAGANRTYNTLENQQADTGFENAQMNPEEDHAENQEDDDNTESYYEPHDNMEANDVEEEEETEQEKRCGICKEEFEQRKGLLTHMRLHQKYKPNCCRYCGQRFIKLSMRIAHQRTHVGNFTLGCVVCGLHVLSKFGLRQHMHRDHYHLSVGITECRYCHAIIDNVYDLRIHFLTHREEVAPSERFSIQFLRDPLPELAVSPLEEDPSQELPPASIESKASHDSPTEMESEPTQGPPPLILPPSSPVPEPETFRPNGAAGMGRSREKDWCRICEKEIPKSAMRYHEREHADQKPYECPLCKKRFGYKNNMKSHMKLHAGIKPYQCQVCGAKFTRGSTLRRHARRHGIVSDTIWDFFVRKNAASRTAVYNQAVNHAVAAAPERQGQCQGQFSQLSPLNSGARAMKADSMYMAGMKPAEPAGMEKSRQMSGFSPGSSGPQPMLTSSSSSSSYPVVPAGPQPMLQPCMTTHQYLRYAASLSSAAHPPAPPQPPESDEALDFSMPDKQRRRNSSSSSSISTQRSPSSSSSLGMSPSLLVSSQTPHCQSLPPTLDRRRSMGSYSDEREIQEERRRNTISFHGSYYHFNKMRASRYGMREGMEHHMSSHNKHPMEATTTTSSGSGRSHASLAQADSHNAAPQDPHCCFNPATPNKDPYPQQKYPTGGCNALDMTVSPRMSSNKSSPWVDNLEEETLESLLASGRLFHCRPCDCYYTDLTMFRIHSKIHVPDHPYLCFLCREDCQDKVTFSRHMLAHLR